MTPRSGTVYALTFPNGKQYIGITTQAPRRRFSQHKCDALRGSNTALHGAWRKYGAPAMQVLAIVSREQLLDTEIRAIAVFKTQKPNGYNLSLGGETPPAWAPGAAAKISAAAKGRVPSPETVLKRARAVRAALAKPEVRARMSAASKGHVVTEETRAKISAAHTGKKLTEEHRAKLKAARARRPPASQETRAKMRAAHLGKTLSTTARAKVSAARRAASARKDTA